MKGPTALTRRAQYNLVYQEGRTWVDGLLVMKALPNSLSFSRFGFSVTKRVGKAVQRNRLKRILREITRLQSVKPGWDIIFIVRPVAVTAGYHQLEKVVTRLLTQSQLLEGNNETANSRFN